MAKRLRSRAGKPCAASKALLLHIACKGCKGVAYGLSRKRGPPHFTHPKKSVSLNIGACGRILRNLRLDPFLQICHPSFKRTRFRGSGFRAYGPAAELSSALVSPLDAALAFCRAIATTYWFLVLVENMGLYLV